MGKKLIEMGHKVCDYTCMWNGIEDLYQRHTGVALPDYFFFCISGIGEFSYLKLNHGEVKRMANWNDGRTKQMYQKVADIAGFTYKFIEGRTFGYALKKAKEQIDKGSPVVLGCLDMYYLHFYPKIYHKFHIPIHYELMVGYDDEKQVVYVHDCGMENVQTLPYSELEKALNIEKTALSDKNTICCIDFSGSSNDMRQIAIEGFKAKANRNLYPEVGFVGIKGMRKLAKEIDHWQSELTEAEHKACLNRLVTSSGTVPVPPARLMGEPENPKIKHQAVRDRFGGLLTELGKRYSFDQWICAGELLLKSGIIIQRMTDYVVDYLLGNGSELSDLGLMVSEIADQEERAYQCILRQTYA